MIPNGADPNEMPKWVKDALTHVLAFGAGMAITKIFFSDGDDKQVVYVEGGKGGFRIRE